MCGEQLSGADRSKHASFLHVYKQIAIVNHVYFLFFTCLYALSIGKFLSLKNTFRGESNRGSKIQIDVLCTPYKWFLNV